MFIVDMELVDYENEAPGYADVYSLPENKVLTREKININNFSDNDELLLEVLFELEKDGNYIGLRLYANEGTQFKINNVYIQRRQDQGGI